MAERIHPSSRFLIPLGLFVVVVVVVESGIGPVGFGFSGRPLAVLGFAVGYAVAPVGFLLLSRVPPVISTVLLAAMAVAALGLHVFDTQGPVIGLFLVAAFAPLRDPRRAAAAIVVASVVGYNVAQLFVASESVVLTIATDAGAAFFFLLGSLLRSEREQRVAVDRLVVELERSRQAERSSSALAERARLAREVHDVLAHTMSGVALQLAGARLLADSLDSDPRLVDALDRAHRLARGGVDEARRAVKALRGDALARPAQLPNLITEHRLMASGPCRFSQYGETVPLQPEVGLAIYRTAQECLSNVRKHAPEGAVDVTLAWLPETVTLTVRNQVASAPASRSRPAGDGGFGLTRMAERAARVGARLEVLPGPEEFLVRLNVSLTSSSG